MLLQHEFPVQTLSTCRTWRRGNIFKYKRRTAKRQSYRAILGSLQSLHEEFEGKSHCPDNMVCIFVTMHAQEELVNIKKYKLYTISLTQHVHV